MEDIRPELCTLRRTIGQALHAARQTRKLPLWKIEKQTGLSARCVDQIELGKGETRLEDILRLSRFLNLEMKIIFQEQRRDDM